MKRVERVRIRFSNTANSGRNEIGWSANGYACKLFEGSHASSFRCNWIVGERVKNITCIHNGLAARPPNSNNRCECSIYVSSAFCGGFFCYRLLVFFADDPHRKEIQRRLIIFARPVFFLLHFKQLIRIQPLGLDHIGGGWTGGWEFNIHFLVAPYIFFVRSWNVPVTSLKVTVGYRTKGATPGASLRLGKITVPEMTITDDNNGGLASADDRLALKNGYIRR